MFSNIIGKIERRDRFVYNTFLNSGVSIGFSFRDCESAADHFNAKIHLRVHIYLSFHIKFFH